MQICRGPKLQGLKARVHVCIHLPVFSLYLPAVCCVELCGLIRAAHANREEGHVERVYYLLYLFPSPLPPRCSPSLFPC